MNTKKKWYTSSDLKKEIEKGLQDTTFGELLSSCRNSEKMTQKELANLLGTTPSDICDLEKGRKIPSPKRAYAIAEALGMYEPFSVQLAIQDYFREQKLKLKISVAA